MTVARVEAVPYSVPVQVPYAASTFHLPLVLVTVHGSDGASGSGIATGPGTAVAMSSYIEGPIAADLVGDDVMAPERTWQRLHAKYNNWLHGGFWSSVLSAVDIALWDLRGKYLGQPVARLLGGASTTAPVYVTFGISEHTVADLETFAKELVAQGHRRLKMTVGGIQHPSAGAEGISVDGAPRVDVDAERVLAVRAAVGPDVELMIDANCRLSLTDATRLCRLLEDARLSWFEEPITGNDPRLLAQLRQGTDIPIAAGQRCGHSWAHRELIVGGAVDISQPNVVNGGGFTECVKVAALARAFNVPIANGGAWPHHNLHLHAGLANGGPVEYHWIAWKTGEALFDNPPSCADGVAQVPEAPGLGFDPKPREELAQYAVTGS